MDTKPSNQTRSRLGICSTNSSLLPNEVWATAASAETMRQAAGNRQALSFDPHSREVPSRCPWFQHGSVSTAKLTSLPGIKDEFGVGMVEREDRRRFARRDDEAEKKSRLYKDSFKSRLCNWIGWNDALIKLLSLVLTIEHLCPKAPTVIPMPTVNALQNSLELILQIPESKSSGTTRIVSL